MKNKVVQIFGNVNRAGELTSGGKGVSVRRSSKGVYFLSFSPEFLNIPTIVVTCIGFESDAEIDNTASVIPGQSSSRVTIYDHPNGTASKNILQDSRFGFIAIGIQKDI